MSRTSHARVFRRVFHCTATMALSTLTSRTSAGSMYLLPESSSCIGVYALPVCILNHPASKYYRTVVITTGHPRHVPFKNPRVSQIETPSLSLPPSPSTQTYLPYFCVDSQSMPPKRKSKSKPCFHQNTLIFAPADWCSRRSADDVSPTEAKKGRTTRSTTKEPRSTASDAAQKSTPSAPPPTKAPVASTRATTASKEVTKSKAPNTAEKVAEATALPSEGPRDSSTVEDASTPAPPETVSDAPDTTASSAPFLPALYTGKFDFFRTDIGDSHADAYLPPAASAPQFAAVYEALRASQEWGGAQGQMALRDGGKAGLFAFSGVCNPVSKEREPLEPIHVAEGKTRAVAFGA
ncbi:hypothetical protein BV25DRAFT_1720303 [Artomyces pyxidatus]|uniref:Uncharacterized protein n=1 Tax=Artomyces pyxidatus TaxID=48021 RepID=A0ACB8SI26_9AGAM|nr:hypothetical protein BV25DRAFT_1720303 [Artomyces pyxidatus]